jgi:hypothetical protein
MNSQGSTGLVEKPVSVFLINFYFVMKILVMELLLKPENVLTGVKISDKTKQ